MMKFGKERVKYKLTMRLHRLAYADMAKLQEGWYFKIKVSRGDHVRLFTTLPNRRKDVKCNKEPQTISMTLFYDAETHTFLEKKMEIEGYLMSDLDESERSLGETTLNILDYLKDPPEQLPLQIKLYDSKQRECSLTFLVTIEREEDDNKSVKTSQTNLSSENGDSMKGRRKDKRQTLKTIEGSLNENSSVSGRDRQAKPPKYPKKEEQSTKSPSLREEKNFQKLSEYQQSQQTLDEGSERKYHKKVTEQMRINNSIKQKLVKKQQISESPLKKRSLSRQSQQTPQLKLFLCQKELKQKERMLQAAKRTIDSQKEIIAQLQQQNNKPSPLSEIAKYQTEIESLKSQLTTANIKISSLCAANHTLQESEREHMRTIETKTKQAAYYKQHLQQTKLKIGNIMQRCFQARQFDFMAVIEQQLNDY